MQYRSLRFQQSCPVIAAEVVKVSIQRSLCNSSQELQLERRCLRFIFNP